MRLIVAEELDTLTIQDMQEWDRRAGHRTGIFLEIIDKPNLTDERLERLKSLARERGEPSKSRAVNADELNARLRQISPRRSPTPSDAPSTPMTAGAEYTWEELTELKRIGAYKKYQVLKSVGRRPSREIDPDPGPCPPWKSDIDKEYHHSDHWGEENRRIGDEITRWLDFRWHQFEMRDTSKRWRWWDPRKRKITLRERPNTFNKYAEAVYRHQQEKGIDWSVELQLEQQTKLDEWREYYIYEHRKRPLLERELERANRKLDSAKEEAEKAKQNRSAGAAWSERAAELISYNKKMSQAQKELDITQKRLEVLRVEESLSAAERDVMTIQAEKDLESAQKTLESQKSEELEQLNREVERTTAQARLRKQQGSVDYANIRLELLDTLLEWIVGQSTEVAAEYASSSWGDRHNCDVLQGWEKYYIYMREKLQAVQKVDAEYLQRGWARERTEAEEAMSDLRFPQESARPLKALLAWIEQEFPEIAAQHALPVQDSQSHDSHQNEADLPNSKPSPSGLARKASLLGVAGKSTRRKGKSTREGSPLSQIQPSKVAKLRQRRRRPLDQKQSTCNSVGPLEGPAVRRSQRISQQAYHPAPPSPTLIGKRKNPSQCCPDGTLRRSARISERINKLRSLGSDREAKSAQSSTIARRKSTRSTNTAYSGTPQRISKTRRWKATSKKGKNV